jgi:hypothetical protein
MNNNHFSNRRMLFLFITICILFSCKKIENINIEDLQTINVGVYITGTQTINTTYTTSTSKAIVWKDGVTSYLGDSTKPCSANSIFVTNSTVYIVGSEGGKATLWKNGIATS